MYAVDSLVVPAPIENEPARRMIAIARVAAERKQLHDVIRQDGLQFSVSAPTAFCSSVNFHLSLDGKEDVADFDIWLRMAVGKAELWHRFVEEPYRHHGFGTKVLRAIEEYVASVSERNKMVLECSTNQPDVIQWLQKNGYSRGNQELSNSSYFHLRKTIPSHNQADAA